MRILDNTYDVKFHNGYFVIGKVVFEKKKQLHKSSTIATYAKPSAHFYEKLFELGYTVEDKTTFEENLKLDSYILSAKAGKKSHFSKGE